jgi:hypothetical protein
VRYASILVALLLQTCLWLGLLQHHRVVRFALSALGMSSSCIDPELAALQLCKVGETLHGWCGLTFLRTCYDWVAYCVLSVSL